MKPATLALLAAALATTQAVPVPGDFPRINPSTWKENPWDTREWKIEVPEVDLSKVAEHVRPYTSTVQLGLISPQARTENHVMSAMVLKGVQDDRKDYSLRWDHRHELQSQHDAYIRKKVADGPWNESTAKIYGESSSESKNGAHKP